MQTLKIEIPNGFVIDSYDAKKGELKIKEAPKKITDRVKSIDDAIDMLGEEDEEVILYRKVESTFKKCHITFYQAMVVIAKALNEGWVPNWKNSNEYKYFAWFEMDGSSGFRFHGCDYWASVSTVGSRLCFKSKELAEYAGNQFTDIYRSFMNI